MIHPITDDILLLTRIFNVIILATLAIISDKIDELRKRIG